MFKCIKKILRIFNIEIFNIKKINQNKIDFANIKKENQIGIIKILNFFCTFLNLKYFLLNIEPLEAENIQFYLYDFNPKKTNLSGTIVKNTNLAVVAVNGFGYSGSGLVIDYLNQYNSFIDPKPSHHPFEFRFIKDTGGVLDLRDHMLNNSYYWNNYSYIQNFLQQVKITSRPWKKNFITKFLWDYDEGNHVGFSLDEMTNNKFSILSKNFINDLIEVKKKFKWWNHYRHLNFTDQIIKNFGNKFLNNEESYLVLNKKFDAETLNLKFKNYLQDVFVEIANYSVNKHYWHYENIDQIKKFTLILDQGVAPVLAKKSLEILPDNSKIVIVHRDPRDVYLSTEDFFPDNPEDFCKIYESEVSKALKQEDQDILHIKFENFVFNTKTEIERLKTFLKIDSSYSFLDTKKLMRTKYNLNWSKSRVGKWKNVDDNKKEKMNYIYKRLKHLCYE
jgi:hypothetical protein